jgi:phosphoribosylformylglycinamidine (FGAM) synthase PurS component
MILCIEISLSIPDNEARTALATLQRLGVPVELLERADLYRCDVEDAHARELPEVLREFETVFNPNKHVLRVREGDAPLTGEVWIDEIGGNARGAGPVRLSGRTLPGVRSLERFIAWRLFAAPGVTAAPDVVTAAAETLLCNPAFQKATR